MDNEILNKYSYLFEECQNLIRIKEILVIPKEELNFYIEMLKLDNPTLVIETGHYTIKINQSLLIILEDFKYKLKEICKNFILVIRKEIKNKIIKNSCYLKKILIFTNLILIFSPEFYTIYNMKMEILQQLKNQFKNEEFYDLIKSEHMFSNIINSQNRKCSISWHYRLFLLKELYICHNLTDKEELTINDEKINFFKKIKFICDLITYDVYETSFIISEIAFIDIINERERRNYHLWKYLIHLFNYIDKQQEKAIIFSFCFMNFLNDTLDYSAYSNTVNLMKKMNLGVEARYNIKQYIEQLIKVFPEKKTVYLVDLLNLLNQI
jgi:hypothetical protein